MVTLEEVGKGKEGEESPLFYKGNPQQCLGLITGETSPGCPVLLTQGPMWLRQGDDRIQTWPAETWTVNTDVL